MGLRSRVTSSQCKDPRVSQRLKRRPTIIDKLAREPSMQLTTMQDIGGCRAVLADIDEIKRVQRRWTQTSHRVTRVYDYLATPKPSGYRGVHVIVTYDGFQIEVQLRTRLQHAWGTAIERVGPEIGADLKSGDGPDEVLRLFRDFGDLLAETEGLPADGFEWGRFKETLKAVEPRILALVGLRVADGGLEVVIPE
jgi:putative GTP pyrophosphokinase